MIPNLNRSDVRQILDRIRRLERANPLSNSSLGRGRMRFYDGSVLLIENGALNVTGSATITGTLNSNGIFNGSGTNNLDGVNHLSGENHLTGPTDVAGDFEIIEGGQFKAGESVILPTGEADFGGLHIDADGTITTGETVIDTNGRAEFGSFVIDPSSDKLIEAPGGWLFTSGPDSLGIASSNSSSVNLNGSYAELNYKGESVVRAEAGLINLNAPRTSVNGDLGVTGKTIGIGAATWSADSNFNGAVIINNQYVYIHNLPTTASPANLYINPTNKRVYRSTA